MAYMLRHKTFIDWNHFLARKKNTNVSYIIKIKDIAPLLNLLSKNRRKRSVQFSNVYTDLFLNHTEFENFLIDVRFIIKVEWKNNTVTYFMCVIRSKDFLNHRTYLNKIRTKPNISKTFYRDYQNDCPPIFFYHDTLPFPVGTLGLYDILKLLFATHFFQSAYFGCSYAGSICEGKLKFMYFPIRDGDSEFVEEPDLRRMGIIFRHPLTDKKLECEKKKDSYNAKTTIDSYISDFAP